MVRTLNVRNLLYRPSLIFLSQLDSARQNGLDLSMTMTCARFCVVSAKKTIQLLHSTDPRLTGPFWYNIFCNSPQPSELIQSSIRLQQFF
jgi:hypothetical protein